MKNVLTIDVEDYFHVAALAKEINVGDWDSITCRVEKNTQKLLDIFDLHNTKSTFFVLGWVANKFPLLIKEIKNRGHEVASHGYSHQLIYNQSCKIFKDETFYSKYLLEDITGKPIRGYRAASYSITKKSLWALDILVEAGFKYDSSIYPVHHDLYGIHGSPAEPHIIQTPSGGKIVEYPLTTYKIMSYTLPVAGGGYFRLYPYWLSRYFYNNINKRSKSFAFYMHPWEIDPSQPRVKTSLFSRFRHYNNLDKCESRLTQLLKDFNFGTMDEKIDTLELYSANKKADISYSL
jgi:polysaccharide deacetylase family protein (PEP-CTERM system associated)